MRHRLVTATAAVAAISALLGGPASAPAQKSGGKTAAPYRLTDLGGFGGGSYVQSYARGLNEPDAGGILLIAGTSHAPTDVPYSPVPEFRAQPALWSADAKTGAVLGLARIGGGVFHDGTATSVNNAGVVVGSATVWVEGEGYVDPAFAVVPGVGLRPVTYPGSSYTAADGVNNNGDIVGRGSESGAGWHVGADGTIGGPVELGSFTPHDINDRGVMAGEQDGAAAVAWFEDGVVRFRKLPGLSAGDGGVGTAINDSGAVVGYSVEYLPDGWRAHPFLWTADGGTTALGSLGGAGGQALDINDRGQVVGWSRTKAGQQRAFLWQDGRMTDLNGLADTGGKGTLVAASGINNAGHIVGDLHVSKPASEDHGFLLTPNK